MSTMFLNPVFDQLFGNLLIDSANSAGVETIVPGRSALAFVGE